MEPISIGATLIGAGGGLLGGLLSQKAQAAENKKNRQYESQMKLGDTLQELEKQKQQQQNSAYQNILNAFSRSLT